MKRNFNTALFCGLTLYLMACSPIKNSQFEYYSTLKSEAKECLQNYPYTSSTSMTGTAVFFKRGVNLGLEFGALKNLSLGDPLQAGLPIRYAEVVVYNSAKEIVQCGMTDALGHLKATDGTSDLAIPAKADSYTVRILSRMNISLAAPGAFPAKPEIKVHVAIKKDLYTNEIHYVTKTVSSNGVDSVTNVDLTAFARQTDSLEVEGGAFNILNSILTTYDFIRNNTGAADTSCLNDKLNVYWRLGFNPFQYSSPNSDPSYLQNGSYYEPIAQNLFITGGRLDDISIDVTNHFDDYVIIHEFSHHIENKCGQLLSPGGSHYILSRVDPRLAWAEGWANFMAAEVMSNAASIANINPEVGPKFVAAGLPSQWTYFFGSKGFSDSLQNIGNGTGFMFDLKKSGNNPDTWQYGTYMGSSFDKVDPNRYPGEGHFREGAITRGLFKLANACGVNCTTSTPITFDKFWNSMNRISGIGQPNFVFKSSHDFLEKLKSLVDAVPGTWAAKYAAFNQLQTSEALHLFSDGAFTSTGINRWIPYGTNLTTVTGGACGIGQFYIEPRSDDPVLTSTNSDQRYSNHFFTVDLNTLASVDEINVAFTKQNSSGTTTEFDLLLFQQDYFFNADYSCLSTSASGTCTSYGPTRAVTSDVVRSDRRSGGVLTKTIKNLRALDLTKKYLLNIRAYTPNKTIASVTDYSYIITNQAGLKICP